VSRTLDALRHHKAPTPPAPPARRGSLDQSVPATLAFPAAADSSANGSSSGKRLALAVVLVGVTALLVWQVAATNGLVRSRLFPSRPSAVADEPARTLPAPVQPNADRGLPIGPPAAQAPPAALTGDRSTSARVLPAVEPPAAPSARPTVKAPAASPAPAVEPPATGRSTAGPAFTGAPPLAPAAAVTRKPAAETDHFKLALYYQRVGDFENALIHYRAVLAENELNAEAHNNLGVLYQSKGLLGEAVGEFQRATFIDPRYEKAHNNLGVALLRSGKTDAAATEFRSIIARDSRNVEALTNLSLALKAAGRPEEARETLQHVLTLNGRYAQAHYNLALIYEERGESQRAVEHYEQFLANAGSENASLSVDVRARVQVLRARLQ
jgi:Tfp pilus assembly protein PilF